MYIIPEPRVEVKGHKRIWIFIFYDGVLRPMHGGWVQWHIRLLAEPIQVQTEERAMTVSRGTHTSMRGVL